jgi:hypothetical protein
MKKGLTCSGPTHVDEKKCIWSQVASTQDNILCVYYEQVFVRTLVIWLVIIFC